MMDVNVLAVGLTVGTSLAAAGGAWGATRTRIRRTEKDVEDLQDQVEQHTADDVKQHTEIVQRLSVIETVMRRIEQKL